MLFSVGTQLKPFSSLRHARWKGGAPLFWGIADQGGSVIDATDNRNACTNHAGVTTLATPRGPALNYNGSNGYTSHTINGLANPGSSTNAPMTFSCWVVLNNTSTCRLIDRWFHYALGVGLATSGKWAFAYIKSTSGTSNFLNLASATSAVANTPTHLCGVWDGSGTGRLYLNGKQDATGTMGNLTTGTFGTPNIGAGNSGSQDFANAKIDDVRLYNYALTPTQVLADYLDPWWRLRDDPPWWMKTVAPTTVFGPWPMATFDLPPRGPMVAIPY